MSSTTPSLPDKPKSRTPLIAGIVAAVVVVAVVVGVLLSRGGGSATTAATERTVRIGVSDQALPFWRTYTDLAAERLGVEVQLVNFTDYSLPNPALAQGEVDINQFQHTQYLANYNVDAGDDLQPIGATAVYPLSLYSTTADSADALPEGAQVALPNDAINQARGLLVLQAAGLLTLREGGTPFSDLQDVEDSRVELVSLDASQTANALQSGSVAAAVVNNNYAASADLADEDVVFADDPESPEAAPYVNLFVTRAEDADDQTYLDLAALFHDPAVLEAFSQDYPGGVVRDVDAATLQEQLAAIEEDARAAQG
ncbi:MetQ/NlpA family ABC transporter substrate-binding protein [Kineococcus sp. SYSU DK004]|uniref:MetQ/NlpA family ABC transporter substrate-binding protein n=1 Tax=Kineococcus sp. SYSU DK004 TaxID=3383125 RepID=UPI003D7C5D19